jgi:DNA-binding IclR family transcriptional regulator
MPRSKSAISKPKQAVSAKPEKLDKPEKEGARTVGRVVATLELLAGERNSLRLVDIARNLNLPASSAHALLRQLVKLEYVQVVGDDRRYEVGPSLALLGSRVVSHIQLIKVARPIIEELASSVGYNTYIAMRHPRGIAYVDCVEGSYGLMMRFPLGSPRPLHASGPGKLYLAFCVRPSALDEVLGGESLPSYTGHTTTDRAQLRRQLKDILANGYAINAQEVLEGAFGISAPIFGPHEEFVGCVTLGIPGVSYKERKATALKGILAAAAEITRRMGSDNWRNIIKRHQELYRASALEP